jgi:hypothetical protein
VVPEQARRPGETTARGMTLIGTRSIRRLDPGREQMIGCMSMPAVETEGERRAAAYFPQLQPRRRVMRNTAYGAPCDLSFSSVASLSRL